MRFSHRRPRCVEGEGEGDGDADALRADGDAVERPPKASLDGKRKTLRRGGFATKREAARELARLGASVKIDDRETVAA